MIRKKVIEEFPPENRQGFPLSDIASFEVSSEDPDHPLEHALEPDSRRWQASREGEQTIRVLFDSPRSLSRIALLFEEKEKARRQEFAIYWRASGTADWREVIRQQFNFSPPSTTREGEAYQVALSDADGIELRISPGDGRASLTHLAIE